jgi:hypothetical protein
MRTVKRRSAAALGFVAAAALAAPRPATAIEGSGCSAGGEHEVAPGVRVVHFRRRASVIPAYKTVSMRDVIYQPGAKLLEPSMPNDMVCHCLDGDLLIDQDGEMQFIAQKGDVWTCAKGVREINVNVGGTVAVMRVADLLA